MTNNLITLLITLVCFICFYNSLENGFVHDDIFAIVNNKDILPNTSVWNIFYNDFWGRTLIDSKSHKSFRPICTLTFRFDYMVFGLNPFGYHLVNVLLHIFVCNVLFQVLRDIILFDTKLSLMATILFATHPVHVEAVTGVVGRADMLSCLFVLLAFKAYHKYLVTTQQDVFFTSDLLVVVAYGTSTFFIKEHSVMIFFVLIGYDALCNKQYIASMLTDGIHSSTKQMQTRFFKRVGFLLVWFLALFRYRMYPMNYTLPKFKLEDNPASFSPHLQTRILTYLYLLIFNLKLLLSPNVLCYDWQIGSIPLVETLSDTRNLETLFGLSFFVITGVNLLTWVFKRPSKDRPVSQKNPDSNDNHALVVGLLFLVIPFLPASNFFIRVGFVVAERILYIPSVGYTILVVVGLNRLCQKFPKFKNTSYFMFWMAVVLFTSKTISYNRVWKTRETLFSNAGVHTLPHNAKAHYNYANFLKDENRTKQAVYHYKKAVELYPPHSSSHNNLATLLQNDQPGVAEYHFNEAIKHTPGHYRAMFNIAHIYRSRGEYEKACDILKTCLFFCRS
ncbi:protein O-mannosyl-transferase TMTC1-like [Clytia hemisphaerica]